MISDDLTALADRLSAYERDGCELHPLAVSVLVATFRDLAERSRVLESGPVPPHLAGGALPPGVVPMRRRSAA